MWQRLTNAKSISLLGVKQVNKLVLSKLSMLRAFDTLIASFPTMATLKTLVHESSEQLKRCTIRVMIESSTENEFSPLRLPNVRYLTLVIYTFIEYRQINVKNWLHHVKYKQQLV